MKQFILMMPRVHTLRPAVQDIYQAEISRRDAEVAAKVEAAQRRAKEAWRISDESCAKYYRTGLLKPRPSWLAAQAEAAQQQQDTGKDQQGGEGLQHVPTCR